MGQFKQHYVLGSSNFSTSTSEHHAGPAEGKQWLVYQGECNRDVNATLTVGVYRTSDSAMISYCDYDAAATGTRALMSTVAAETTTQTPILVPDGCFLAIIFGAAQGAAAKIGFSYIEEAV